MNHFNLRMNESPLDGMDGKPTTIAILTPRQSHPLWQRGRYALAALVAGLTLVGCQHVDTTAATNAVAELPTTEPLAGMVMGGRQPIAGAKVYVRDASATVGTPSVQIVSAVSNALGAYSITGFNPTPANGDLIYVVSVGGNAGEGVNSTATLLAVAGIYNASTQTITHPATVLNELTTVASLSKLLPNVSFPACSSLSGNLNDIGTCVNVQASSAGGWASMLSSIDALTNVSTGVAGAAGQSAAPGTTNYINMTTLNLEASVLANCVNSTGGSQGDSTACGNLFDTANNGVSQGGLTYLGGGNYFTGQSPIQVAITPNGNFLYVTNNASNAVVSNQGTTITGYAIKVDGSLTPLSGSPFTTGVGPKSVVITPNGKYLHVNAFTDKTIWGYSINALTGNLTVLAGVNWPYNSSTFEGGTPNVLAVDPSGQYLAIGTSTTAGFASIAADGSLTHYSNLTTVPGKTVAGDSYSAVALGASQLNVVSGTAPFSLIPKVVSLFGVSDTASTLNQNFYCDYTWSCRGLTAGRNVSGAALTPNGSYAYIVNRNDNTISMFNSTLSSTYYNVAGTAVNAGSSVTNIRNFTSNLTPTITLSCNGPRSVHVSANNKFVYVTCAGANSVTTTPSSNSGNAISVYQITAATGLLTEIAGSPFFTDTTGAFNSTTHTDFIALHPNGRYAYVLRQGKNDLAVFAVGTFNPLMAYAQMFNANSSGIISKLYASTPAQNAVYSPLPVAAPASLIPQ